MPNKIKFVYSRRIKDALIKMGYVPVRCSPNKTKKGFDVWEFERKDNFDNDFDTILRGYGYGNR